MGDIRNSRTLTAIEASIEDTIRETDASLDLSTGTAVKDIVVDAPATQVRDLAVLTDFVGSLTSLDQLLALLDDESYIDDLETALPELTEDQIFDLISDYIDGMASNFGITRTAARQAQYTQRFYRSDNNGGSPVTVPVGTQVQNEDGTITAEVRVSTAQVPQLDAAVGLYYVEETVVALTVGSGGNTALNSLRRFLAAIPSVAIQTGNVATLVEGRDEENDANLVQRIKDSFRGRNVNTIVGYNNLLRAEPLAFTDTKVVGPGNPLMVRLATGGIDIYVIGSEPGTLSEQQQYVSVRDEYLLSFQPVSAILSVSGTVSGSVAPANWQLLADTSAFSGSAKARAKLKILNPSAFVNGETITITYTQDTLIVAAQNLLESDDYNVPDADVLVKQATQVPINLTVELILDGSLDLSTVRSNLESDFAAFLAGGTTSRGTVLAAYGIGDDIDKSDLIRLLASVRGVDRVDLDTFVIKAVRGGVATTQTTDPVEIADNEYARAGSVTYV